MYRKINTWIITKNNPILFCRIGLFFQQQSYKPGSVNFYHLSGPAIADRFKQPTHPGYPLTSGLEASSFRSGTYLVFQLLRFTAIPVARESRELLPHVFTLTPTSRSGLFSVALSVAG